MLKCEVSGLERGLMDPKDQDEPRKIDVTIRVAESRRDLDDVIALVRAYQSSLDVDLNVQGIERELATLPGPYAPPRGALLLARASDGRPIGCVALRPFDDAGAAELKRLYVRPDGRGSGAGRALLTAAIAFAEGAGYRDILLDSLPGMTAATALYRALGFVEIAPYWDNVYPGIRYYGKRLGGDPPAP